MSINFPKCILPAPAAMKMLFRIPKGMSRPMSRAIPPYFRKNRSTDKFRSKVRKKRESPFFKSRPTKNAAMSEQYDPKNAARKRAIFFSGRTVPAKTPLTMTKISSLIGMLNPVSNRSPKMKNGA